MNFPTPIERFALTTSALCRAVAACLGRGLMDVPMIVLVWTRVRRAEWAFLALVERVRLGRYRGGWTRAGGVVARPARAAGGSDRLRLPRRFGWLMRVMPYEAAGYGLQLRAVLGEPEMVALLADVPAARRILGPVCRMLGVEIPGVKEPVAQPAVVKTPRVRRVRVPLDIGRVPLPRGVLTAARRQGFGKRIYAKDG